MSWQDPEAVASAALNDVGFRGRGGEEVFELSRILQQDLTLELLIDGEYMIDAADRIRELTRSYILNLWSNHA